jgi:hypothetical protein
MPHKIAIITTKEYARSYGDEYDGYDKIIESITDWEEVTDAEFKTLQHASHRLNFSIIEQPTDVKKFVAKTIADYKAICAAEELRAAEEKRVREEAALQRKFKKELKDKGSKEKMLKKLAEELGVDLTGLPAAVLPK